MRFLIAYFEDGKVCIETVYDVPELAQIMAWWVERENV